MSATAITDFPLHYERHFAVVRATTPELLRKAYRLRYQAYCVENPFEDPEQQIDQCEIDKYDEYSEHTLLLHRRTGEVAGTSRVILPPQGDVRSLPIATLLNGADRRRFRDVLTSETAEISRFAILKQFRRRCGEEAYADMGITENASDSEISERHLLPFIILGLLRGVFGICLDFGVTNLAAVMEPPLIRIFRRLGLHFTPIGGLVEHHGVRQPCIARLADLVQHSRDSDSLVWQYAIRPLLSPDEHRDRGAIVRARVAPVAG